MMLAADVAPDMTVGVWVVGVILTGIVSALGFFLRSSFEELKRGQADGAAAVASVKAELGAKLDSLSTAMNKGDIARAVLEARLEAQSRELGDLRTAITEIRRELRQLSEGPTR